MCSSRLNVVTLVVLAIGSLAIAQTPPTPPSTPPTPPEDTKAAPTAGAVVPAPKPTPIPPREQLEKDFVNALTGATLEGVWQMTTEGGLKEGAGLTAPKPDKYTITTANKLADENWIIQARIQFGDKDVSVPVPVRVVWAEDTAIITLNDLAVPMIGTYSARVMVHKGFYSGVWYSNEKNYGGVMQGRISKTPAAPAAKPTP